MSTHRLLTPELSLRHTALGEWLEGKPRARLSYLGEVIYTMHLAEHTDPWTLCADPVCTAARETNARDA